MPTPHNEAEENAFAKTVIMPGDPLRAKYIAESFLEDATLINEIRSMYAYTGKYHGKSISVMGHGMGNPSMGIYSYELYKYYGVENIIRVGSSGGVSPNLGLFDIVLSENVFSESNYALTLKNEDCHFVNASNELNEVILDTSKEINIKATKGNVITADCFTPYIMDYSNFIEKIPEGFNPLAVEMEAFALFYNAKVFGKRAACLLSVVDSPHIKEEVSAHERQTKLDTMIKLALEAGIRL